MVTSAKAKVLVVDDRPENIELLQRVFRTEAKKKIDDDFALEIEPAASAEEALRKVSSAFAKGERYDIVITDHNMDGGDNGVHLAQKLRVLDNTMPIAVYSSNDEKYIRRLPENQDVDIDGLHLAFIDKGFDLEQIQKLYRDVQQALHASPNYKLRQELSDDPNKGGGRGRDN